MENPIIKISPLTKDESNHLRATWRFWTYKRKSRSAKF